jgi:urease accessory protein
MVTTNKIQSPVIATPDPEAAALRPLADAVSSETGSSAQRHLLTWLSPAFPVGAFSYSHGLEWTVEAGDVRDVATLVAWIEDILRHGGGRNDAILFVHSWRAAAIGDRGGLRALAALGTALATSRERHLEATGQGAAFLAAIDAVWPAPVLDALTEELPGGVPYPVVVAAATAAHGIALEAALQSYLLAFATNLVSAGVRLIPLGQTDGLRALARLDSVVAEVAAAAPTLTLEDLGGCVVRADIAAMRHETQYTRLFRS